MFVRDDRFRFARCVETTDGIRILINVLIVLPLERVEGVRHSPAVKESSKARVTRHRLDHEDAVVNRQQQDIKCPATKIRECPARPETACRDRTQSQQPSAR